MALNSGGLCDNHGFATTQRLFERLPQDGAYLGLLELPYAADSCPTLVQTVVLVNATRTKR